MREALFYERRDKLTVSCGLCRFRCLIRDGDRGRCAVRENRGGVLYSLVYGKIVAEQVDPIEKKPLYHVLPGSRSLSIATVGCNFRCRHCQNYGISQVRRDAVIAGTDLSPMSIVESARAAGCQSISYTYTEPTVFFEFAYDTAVLAHRAGLKNIFVTNGYISREALAFISPFLDAVNIDLKAFSETFYREFVGAELAQVLDSILEFKRSGIWVELTTLLIPGLNDSDEELVSLARFLANHVGRETPWHVSRFHPAYRLLDRPPTPLTSVHRARKIGLEAGLQFVYEGNVPGGSGETTNCPVCVEPLIVRDGYRVLSSSLSKGCCSHCNCPVPGLWA